MYITATLPDTYGAFRKIQIDNYPFAQTFERYLHAITSLGNELNLAPYQLLGMIEDTLLGDDRIPDIPKGKRKINFRFKVNDDMIIRYYQAFNISNKMITLAIVQTTLRLSAKFGTSLARLTIRLERLSQEPLIYQPLSHLPPAAPEKTKKDVSDVKVITHTEHTKHTQDKKQQSDEIVKRLERITQKGDMVTQTNEDDVVVEANPLLDDFF